MKYNCTGVKRKQKNPTNWAFAALPMNRESAVMLPEEVSIKQKFPPVYTQLHGDCTTNAVLACDAYYYHNPNWDPSRSFTYHNQHILDEEPFDIDDGSTVETAIDAVRKYGACNSKIWPNTKPITEKPTKEAYKNGLKGKEITKYYNTKTILQIKKALANGYPVAAAVAWAFEDYDNLYILNDVSKKEANKCDRGHAIVIVGYNDRLGIFEIRNSWGPEWANNGYAYITYDTMRNVLWYDDTYAIVR